MKIKRRNRCLKPFILRVSCLRLTCVIVSLTFIFNFKHGLWQTLVMVSKYRGRETPKQYYKYASGEHFINAYKMMQRK